MASGLAEIRRGPGIKDSQISPTAGIRRHKLKLDDRYFYDNFKGRPLCAKADGAGAATGTAGDVNLCNTGKNIFEYFIIGTQTVVAPVIGASGLDIKLDDGAAGSDGAEFSLGITAQSPAAFTVGTDAFYMKLKFKVTDQSGLATFFAGFRLVEASQAAITGYNTYGAIGYKRVNAATTGDVYIASELDGDANTDVDTTDGYTEATSMTLGVFVDLGGNFRYEVDGVAPTVTEALQATAGDVMVPFFRFTDHTDTPGAVLIEEFECGLIDADVR
jgi:hypothetical protein